MSGEDRTSEGDARQGVKRQQARGHVSSGSVPAQRAPACGATWAGQTVERDRGMRHDESQPVTRRSGICWVGGRVDPLGKFGGTADP